MVLLKSLAARMESYGLQSHMRGYTNTQGAAPWLLSATQDPLVPLIVVLEGLVWYLVPCMRVYICRDTGSQRAAQCSLVSRWYYGVLG